ncbi:MAG: Peptidylprolyl isomerase [Verrucomicrobia bacterium]|nr:Peptidylprolyl isomerase [Verrucomicrobiota bacterium]
MRFLCACLAAVAAVFTAVADVPAVLPDGLYAEFSTPRGVLTAELFYGRAPLTVANFVGLAEGTLGPKPGTPFFDGLKFHRVVPDFVVQGGDPLGTGEGGPGYSFPDEFVPGLRHDSAGILSMANDGPDTNGSQFFLTLREVNRLNYLHAVFGRIVRGVELLPLIQQGDAMTAVAIRRIGPVAKAFRCDRPAFEALVARTVKFHAAPAPGPKAHFDDPAGVLPIEPPRALAFQRKLANYERATGRKVYARMAAKFMPETPGQKTGALAGKMAGQIGLAADGVLAVYFADIDQWALWIGDDCLPAFTGRSGESLAKLIADGGLHRAKEDFLAAARRQGDLAIADYTRTAPPDKPVTAGQKIKLQVDAVLDALLFRFEPHPRIP